MHESHDDIHRCIAICADCSAMCTQTSIHCLSMGPEHTAPEHQILLQDCADICSTAVRFMARGSAHHTHVCRECAEICERCAADCEDLAHGDRQMMQCADLCRRCADSCRHMSEHASNA
jgi:hypothetical protein